MLICDGCEEGYHTFCLVPKLKGIPRGDWFCTTCAERRNGSTAKKTQAKTGVWVRGGMRGEGRRGWPGCHWRSRPPCRWCLGACPQDRRTAGPQCAHPPPRPAQYVIPTSSKGVQEQIQYLPRSETGTKKKQRQGKMINYSLLSNELLY